MQTKGDKKMKYNRIDEIVLELVGIQKNLLLVGDLFNKTDDSDSAWDNETVSDTLSSIALHIGRISQELDALN